jgi:NhaA family Na+:H+ antiporter
VVPLIAAAGGVLGAALAYLTYVELKHEAVLAKGWLVAVAFDITFAYFVVKSIFKRHPAVSFVLVMAIATNAAGLVLVGLQYPSVAIRPGGTALMVAALALAAALRKSKVHRLWPYLLICGPLSWWALYLDGFHPALALVPIVPFLPHKPRSVDTFEDTEDAPVDSPRHFEHQWNYAVQAVLFMFALVNAGVLLHRHGTGTWALLTGALAGRPLGILAAAGIAIALGLRLPPRLHWRDLVVVALASSSGFAFALFAAVAVYPIGPILSELTLGAVLSGFGVVAAFAAARFLHVGRFAMRHNTQALIAAALILLPAALVSAQSQQVISDDQIRAIVEQRLIEKDIVGVQVSVATQVVTLSGTVPNLWMKEKALERARETHDVNGVVSEMTIARAENDSRIADEVASRVRRYVFFSIFDDIDLSVDNGIVTLTGKVTMPYKAGAFVDLASRVNGVQEVTNHIQTLPVSTFDDQLRYRIARQIYGDPMFWNLALQVDPPLHIVVENGHVTLTGVVNSEVERRVAETIARSTFGVFSVHNKLRLDRND